MLLPIDATAAFLDPPETTLRYRYREGPVTTAESALRSEDTGIPSPSLAETFRHSGWAPGRRRVYTALQDTQQSPGRIERFADCGARAYVYRSLDDPAVYRVAGSTCRDRFCSPCTRERGQAIAANITARLDGKRARFLTLTLRTENLPLVEALAKLQRAFRNLCRTPLWASRVDGGVAFLEVKYNPSRARWHPHIHALVQGRYIPFDLLRKAWLRITTDSHIVRIQVVHTADLILRYVTTYASKTLRTADFPTDESLREAVAALHGTRLCRTFGTWRGMSLTDTPTSGTWEPVGLLTDLLAQALQGDPYARSVIRALPGPRPLTWLNSHPPRSPPLAPPTGAAPRTPTTFDFPPCPLF